MRIRELRLGGKDKPLTLIATIALCLTACGVLEPPARQRSFTLQELLLEQDTVSSAWEAFDPFCPCRDDLCTTECVVIQFGVPDRESPIQADHKVYRYRSSGIAQRTFEQVYLLKVEYFDPVGEWTYQSPIADQSNVGCYDGVRTKPVCEWAGRYEEYIVIFGTQIISGEMSLEDMERVVQAIDARMARYLSP